MINTRWAAKTVSEAKMSVHFSKQVMVHNQLWHRTKWQPRSPWPDHWWGVSDSDMVCPSRSTITLTGRYIAKNRKTERSSWPSLSLSLFLSVSLSLSLSVSLSLSLSPYSLQHCAVPQKQCHWDERNYPQRQNQMLLAHRLHTDPVKGKYNAIISHVEIIGNIFKKSS